MPSAPACDMPGADAEGLRHVLRAVEAARLGTFDADLATGLVALSPRARECLGFPAGDTREVSREALRARVVEEDLRASDEILEAALQRPDGSFHVEVRVRRPDGTLCWIVLQGAYVFDAGDVAHRTPLSMAGVMRDTSAQQLFRRRAVDRPRVPLAMHDVEEITDVAMRAAHIGTYEWNPQTDEAVWSPEMRRLFGIGESEEVHLSRALACVYRDDFERVKQALAAAMDPAGDGCFEVEHRIVAGREIRWVASVGRCRFEERDGERHAVRLVGAAIDITARKNLEAALREANRRKDEFLAMLGHELRNPLAPLRTASELMRCGELEPHQMYAIQEMIARQVAHMTRLVDDLLDTARIGQGKLSLGREPVELRSLVAAAVETARAFTEPRRMAVGLRCADDALWVEGDAVRLTQVVSNLLHNAAKFSEDGAAIELTLAREDGQACLHVRDHGKGIAPDFLPRVFDRFAQGGITHRRERGGLGLGLALVRELVRLHGGTVAAASAGRGQGSEFVVRLPLVTAPAGAPAGAPAAQAAASRTCRRVLVVDDNADAAESLKMLLELSGQEVSMAHNGAQALERFDAERPDLVLVDIGLPDIDGCEVARRLRARPECDGVLLAALTGYGGAEDRERSLAAGFDRHLVKPVVPGELFELLHGKRDTAPAARREASATHDP